MTPAPRGSGLGYAIAFGGVLGLVLLHGLAGQPASADVLFLLFLAVITVAGWAGGFAPALGATLFATL
ncbi:MAG TPA: hypothetical protein VFX50_10020, partial [Gemmatimonadales bacterium]|nr:hypothetical protein [Gemmatimonadales bacterium]